MEFSNNYYRLGYVIICVVLLPLMFELSSKLLINSELPNKTLFRSPSGLTV